MGAHSKELAPLESGGVVATSQARCERCGVSVEKAEPEARLRRAERILWIAETIAAQAQRDDDARLALQAVDRAHAALETMMKAGFIGGDGSTTVNIAIDNRRKTEAIFAKLTEEELRALAYGKPLQIPSGDAIDVKVQPVENGTALRDAESTDTP